MRIALLIILPPKFKIMKMKKSKFASFILLAVIALSLLNCSKGGDKPSNTSHKIVFKAEASAGSALNMAVYGYDATLTTVSGLGGITWTSPEITAPSNVNLANITVNAIGVNASSTLKVQIYVNGVLKKEGTSTGTALSATAQYLLR